ncbi:MAG: hypothetical protein QXO51_07445 [Halobacteria archaeon]
MEEARYSRWKGSAPPRAEVELESFRALFQSRYPNKMNRVAQAFLEAYAAAARETVASHDRFPNLQEVQRRMSTGDAYNFKHRLVGAASFFREVDLRPQGVFLVPVSPGLADRSGTYSPLEFDFEAGTVRLPALLKAPPPSAPPPPLREATWRQVFTLERPVLYIVLVLSMVMNAGLVLALVLLALKS